MHLITSLLLQHYLLVEHVRAADSCPPACCGICKGLWWSYSELPKEFEHSTQSETENDHLSSSDALHALAEMMGIQSRLIRGDHYRTSSVIELVTAQRSTNKGFAAPGLPEGRARKDSSLPCSLSLFHCCLQTMVALYMQ